jgi:hypothetical protein
MALRIPKSLIITSKYTSGKEYMFKSTQKEYKGYYYELNGNFFAGKEYKSNANELLKISINNINPFLSRALTSTYGFLSNIKILDSKPIGKAFIFDDNDIKNGYKIRYFAKKLNVTPTLIKEINEEEYKTLQSNLLYQVITIKYLLNNDNDLYKFNQLMPGLGDFLSLNVINTSSANDN